MPALQGQLGPNLLLVYVKYAKYMLQDSYSKTLQNGGF